MRPESTVKGTNLAPGLVWGMSPWGIPCVALGLGSGCIRACLPYGVVLESETVWYALQHKVLFLALCWDGPGS